MKLRPSTPRSPLLLVLLLAVPTACRDARDDADVVARVGSYRLTVDEIVTLMADAEDLPVSGDVVEAVAGLWIDYTLLAQAAARDTTLSSVDFHPLVRARLEQEALATLGDSAIQVDTIVAEEDIRARYEDSDDGIRFRARHLMLQYPLQATAAQRDSVRARLTEIRSQIVAGATFEDMARAFSQDRGSAAQGGDLGYFSSGDLVRPFEEAVNALDPGEMSDVVETPMGLHLIRLEDRERTAFDEAAGEIRERLRVERVQQAESLFVAGVEERAGTLRVREGAPEIVRDLASNPAVQLAGRAARRPLVEWDSGAFTAGRLLELLRLEAPAFQEQVAAGDDPALEDFLTSLARRDLLLSEATRAGLAATQARADSLAGAAASQVLAAARRLDLIPLERAPGEALEPALKRAVLNALAENLSGASPTIPLGPLSYEFRAGAAQAISNAGVGRAVLELGRVRAARGAAPNEQSPDAGAESPEGTAP